MTEHRSFPLNKAIPLLVFIICVLVAGVVYVQYMAAFGRERATYRTISAAEAKSIMESDSSLLILDVRSNVEYESSHLKDAVNVPLQNLTSRLVEFDKNAAILVYCGSGQRSSQACTILVERGFTKVFNIQGGIAAWREAGYLVVS